jgi:hypothetical protein
MPVWWALTIDGWYAGDYFCTAAELVPFVEKYFEAGYAHVRARMRRFE